MGRGEDVIFDRPWAHGSKIDEALTTLGLGKKRGRMLMVFAVEFLTPGKWTMSFRLLRVAA